MSFACTQLKEAYEAIKMHEQRTTAFTMKRMVKSIVVAAAVAVTIAVDVC